MLSLPKDINEHYGKNSDKMPKILNAGETPISVAEVMKARLNKGNDFPDLWNNYFDSSDLVVYPKRNNNDIYVLLTVNNKEQVTKNGRKALELINSDNLASNSGAVVGQLRDLGRKGLIKISRNKITTGTYLTSDKILNEQVWRVLARHPDEVPSEFAEDKGLLQEYVNEIKSRKNNTENMAIYLGDSLNDKTTLKAWCVGGLGGGSGASGGDGLVNVGGRLLGIAPEVLSASGKSIENKVYTFGEILEESGNTNDFAPNQIKRLSNIFEQNSYQIQKKK